jgi:16S rRNA (cytidine1402-2'-O)-methyltransferase
MSARGTLFVIATPIGNLEDLSPRAITILRRASAIYCEDTRVTGKLAARFGLSAPRISCHVHNEAARWPGYSSA